MPAGGNDTAVYKIYSREPAVYTITDLYEGFVGEAQVVHGDTDGDGEVEFVSVPGVGGGPHVRVWKPWRHPLNYTSQLLAEWLAYDEGFRGGLNVLTADFDGDGDEEITIAPLSSGGPNVRTYAYENGRYELMDWFFSYAPDFRGGVWVHAADIDNDGADNLIVAPVSGSAPIKVYTWSGSDFVLMDEFFAFAQDFTGGMRVRVGDVSDASMPSSADEIVVTPTENANPEVKIYVWNEEFMKLDGAFLAYGDRWSATLSSGVNMRIGNVEGTSQKEIVTTAWQEAGYPLRVWQHHAFKSEYKLLAGRDVSNVTDSSYGTPSGINLALRDLQTDHHGTGHAEIILAPRRNANARVWQYQLNFDNPTNLEMIQYSSVFVFDTSYRGEIRFDGAL